MPASILERGERPPGPRGGGTELRAADNALPARAPTATAAAAAGGSGRRAFPSQSHPRRRRRLPKAGAGRAGAGPVGRRVPQPTWPRWPSPPGGRCCRGAGLAPGPVSRAGPERRGVPARSRAVLPPGPPPGSCPRQATSENAYPFGGSKEAGCGRGMRGSLLVCMTLNLASFKEQWCLSWLFFFLTFLSLNSFRARPPKPQIPLPER